MHENETSGENLWSTLLSEVHATAATRHNAYGAYGSTTGPQILIVGSEQVGKAKLIASLSNSDEASSVVGLGYHCLTFKEEQEGVTETLQLGIWCLDGDPVQSNLIKFALNETNIWHTMLLVCVPLTEPWYILNELQMWLRIVQQHVVKLKLVKGELRALQRSIEDQFKLYTDPAEGVKSKTSEGDGAELTTVPQPTVTQSGRRGSHCVTLREAKASWPYSPLHPLEAVNQEQRENGDEDVSVEDPGDGNPLGIPLVIVVTKVDCFPQMEREFGFTDEHLDTVQYHLRKLCLQYRAGLIYTSTKEAINTELLFRYLKHRLYDLPFSTSACLIDPVAIFIPSGWDSEHRLELLRKNLPESSSNEKFASNFPRPSKLRSKTYTKGKKSSSADPSSRADDAFVLQTADDEQAFLARMQIQLQQMQTPSPGSTVPGDGSGLSKLTSDACNAAAASQPSASGPSTGSGLSDKEAVLSSFFNSLLTRKNLSNETTPTSSPAPPSTGSASQAVKPVTRNISGTMKSPTVEPATPELKGTSDKPGATPVKEQSKPVTDAPNKTEDSKTGAEKAPVESEPSKIAQDLATIANDTVQTEKSEEIVSEQPSPDVSAKPLNEEKPPVTEKTPSDGVTEQIVNPAVEASSVVEKEGVSESETQDTKAESSPISEEEPAPMEKEPTSTNGEANDEEKCASVSESTTEQTEPDIGKLKPKESSQLETEPVHSATVPLEETEEVKSQTDQTEVKEDDQTTVEETVPDIAQPTAMESPDESNGEQNPIKDEVLQNQTQTTTSEVGKEVTSTTEEESKPPPE